MADEEIPPPIGSLDQLDEFGRPVISSKLRTSIANAFAQVPEFKTNGTPARGALLIIADETGEARAVLAAKLGDDWKVAGGAGYQWKEKKPSFFVGVEYVF